MWAEDHRFGVYTQDPIAIDKFISEPGSSENPKQSAQRIQQVDRRVTARKTAASARHEQSRLMARSTEFLCLIGASMILTGVAFSLAQAAVSEPMTRVNAALAPHKSLMSVRFPSGQFALHRLC